MPRKSAEPDLSDSDSELDSDALGSDKFDLEIDMVDQPSRGGMLIFLVNGISSFSAILVVSDHQ